MAERIDEVEVGVTLNDRDLVDGIAQAETRVDKFAAKVRKTKAVATVDLNLQKFKVGVREVNAWIKDLNRKEAKVAIRADTKGFLRAYAEVKLALSRLTRDSSSTRRFPLFERMASSIGRVGKSFFEVSGLKQMFDKSLQRTPADFLRQLSKMRVQMGFFSTTVSQAITFLTLFGPIVNGVAGGLTALVGVLGSATLGLGALGAAAGGAAVAGLGGVAMLIPSLLRDFKNLNTLQAAYHKQILKTGVNSDKAKVKLKEYRHALGAVTPTTLAAFQSFNKLQDRFRSLRKEARSDFFNALGSSIDLVNKRFVLFRHTTLNSFHALSEGWQRWMRGLQGKEAANIFASLAGNARKSIGPLMDALGNVATVLGRIAKSAAHWLPTFSQQFKNWTDRLKESVQPGDKLNNSINRMVGHLRDIGNLARAAGSLLVTVFKGGASSGDDMVNSLTSLLTKWNTFLQSTRGQNALAKFFADSKDTLSKLGPALLNVIGSLAKFSEAVRPIAVYMLQIVGAFGLLFGALASVSPVLATTVATMLLLQRVGVLIPVFKGLAAAIKLLPFISGATGVGIFIAAVIALAAALKYAYDHSKTFHRIVNQAFAAVKAGAQAAISWLSVALPKAWHAIEVVTRAVWPSIAVVVKTAWESVKSIVSGGVQIVRGVIQVFSGAIHGDFSKMWSGVKNIFSGAWKVLKGFMEGRVAVFSGIADAIGRAMHSAFGKRWDGIVSAAEGFINKVIDIINFPLKALGIDTIGHVGGGGKKDPTAANTKAAAGQKNLGGSGHLARGGAFERTGGFVGAPITLMGEEAPRHPEWVIPTNPAYRDRAVGLWAAAGASIGAFAKGGKHEHVQGYAEGGVVSAFKSAIKSAGATAKEALALFEAGIVESRLRNLPNGDRDSVGALQQRPSQGWTGLMNPFRAAMEFLAHARALQPFGGSAGQLAQAVQRSGYPDRYDAVRGQATAVLGGKGVLSKILGTIGGAVGSIIPDVHLPGVPKGLGPFGEVLGAVGKKIKDKVTSMVGLGGGGGALGKGVAGTIKGAISLARSMGFSMPSTGQLTGGDHAPNSYHYQGRAVDFGHAGRSEGQMRSLFNALKSRYGGHIKELFYDPMGYYIKNGRTVKGAIGGHSDHIHLALRKGGVYGGNAFKKGGKHTKGATATKKKPLTKTQVKAQKRGYDQQIADIDEKLSNLRASKTALPGGKAGARRRNAINQQIAALMRKKARIQRLKKALPTGVDPKKLPTRGATSLNDPQVLAAQEQTAIDTAGSTPGLLDDIAATTSRAISIQTGITADQARLTKIRHALRGKLTKSTRDRLLKEQDDISQRLPTARTDVAALNVQREELGIQHGFAGGQGLAGLDLLKTQAEGTTDLGDDVSVMNQQLALWQQLLAARTKRGDLSGMQEAVQNITQLNSNLADANKQMQEQSIRGASGLDAAEFGVQYADAGHDLAEQYAAVHSEYAALLEAQAGAHTMGRTDLYNDYAIRIRQDAERMADLGRQMEEARVAAQLAPLEANRALAQLTDTTTDDVAATKALLGFHEQRLAYFQSISDYAGITEEAGAVKGLRDELNQSQGSLFEQTRLFGEARADLYKTFGSNYDPITPAGTPVGGKQVVVNNYFKYQPLDAHNWSRDMLFELQAAG